MADKRVNDLTLRVSPPLTTSSIAIDHATNGTERIPLSQLTGTNVVIVNSATDFPAPSAGVITLEDNCTYVLGTSVSISDRLATGADASIIGFGTDTSVLVYTGSGVLFTTVDTNFTLRDMSITATTGTVFSADSSGSALKFITCLDVNVNSCASLGTFDDINFNGSNFASLANADGLTVTSTSALFVFVLNGFTFRDTSGASTGLDISGCTTDKFVLRDGAFIGTGIGLAGSASSADITAGHVGLVEDVEFDAISTPLSGIARDDMRWSFHDCAGILHSFHAAEATLLTQQTVTITVQDQFEVVNGVNWTDALSESFTISTAGLITYIGEVDATFKVSAMSTVDKVAGGSNIIAMRISHNGTDIANSESRTQNADPSTIYSQTIVVLSQNDTINTEVANRSGTGNINVDLSNIIVTEVN